MKRKSTKLIQWILSVVLLVVLLAGAVSGSAMKGAQCEAAYKLTEEQLFMQCPWYLNNQMTENYLTKCVDDTLEAMDDVSTAEEYLASFMHGLRDGRSFILREVASACGITDSNYDAFKKEMAGELVRAYMGNSDAVSEIASDVSEAFSDIKRMDDIMTNSEKTIYVGRLSEACTGLSDEQILTAVNSIYEHHDSISKFVSEAIDIFDLVTGIIAMQELELRVIDELILTQTGMADADLMDGLVALRYDITSGIGNYIVQNYCVDKVLDYFAELFTDAIGEMTGIKSYFECPQAILIKIAINEIAAFYEKYRPSVNDIVHTTLLYNYFKLFEDSVNQQYIKFLNEEGTIQDISTYQTAYKGQIVAIKLMMEKAKKLTDDKRLKNRLEMYAQALGETITYEAYINGCLANTTKDIESGKLTVTETSVTEKTDDGTIIDENYDSTASIAAKFSEIQKVYVPNVGQTWTCSWGGASQCFGFARMVFSKLFGCEMPSAYIYNARYQYKSENNVDLIGQLVGDEVTTESVKSLAAQGKLGDIIQACGATYGQHTMVFVSADSDGIKVYDCNANLHGISCEINQWTISYDTLANWYGTASTESANGISLYRASNYAKIYGNGDGLFYDDTVNFVIDENGVLTKYNGWQQFVEIPDTVTAIGEEAFLDNTTMVSVEIPDGVKSIGNYAFKKCTSLIGTVIPDSVESIGHSAFEGCSSLRTAVLPQNNYLKRIVSATFVDCIVLKEIEIPDSVTVIEGGAFENCVELEEVKLSAYIEEMEACAFKKCKKLKSIYIPKSLKTGSRSGNYDDKGGIFTDCISLKEVTFEKGIKEIASYLFWDCDSLENIEIPTTVSKIGSGAFGACDGLKEIEIPSTVTEIEGMAFYYCTLLENVALSENLTTICNSTFQGCEKLQEIEIPDSVTKIENSAFLGCVELNKVILSNCLEELGYSSFKDCKKLTSIYIPKSLKYGSHWGDYNDAGGIFTNCSSLKEVTFEEGITKIANDLFYDCDSLESIEIPDTVIEIGDRAFGACDNLKEIEIPNNVTKMGSNAFEYCSHLEKATLSQSLTKIDSNTFKHCNQLKEIDIPNSVIEIGECAFYGCTELAEVELSSCLETIGAGGFYGCKKLESISIPTSLKSGARRNSWDAKYGVFSNCPLLKEITFEEGITEIANDLFYDCDSLERIEIPNTVKVIKASAFEECDALNEIIIPEGVTQIKNYAFKLCAHLEEINLPDTINSIDTYAFGECSTLTKVHLPKNMQTIAEGAFYNCIKLKDVNMPDKLKVVSSKAFYNCDELTEVIIPENVTVIEQSAFQDCVSLQVVVIPNAVTTLGSYAFQGCDALESVTLGTGLTAIPESCFSDCGSLTSMTLPYNVTTIGSKAFANSPKMLEISIPRKTTSISSDAFSYKSRTTVYGATGTYAETFAQENNMIFVAKDIPATEVTISITNKSIDKGKKIQLAASVLPADYNGEIVWSSSDETVAAVDEEGLVTTKAYGTTVITINAGAVSALCNLTVKPSILHSPVVDTTESTITFNFAPEDYNITDANFNGVSLMGTLPGTDWTIGAAMTLTSEGNYTITLENIPAGDYYYKFKTNSGQWFMDTKNSLGNGENSYVYMPKLVSPDVPELVVTPMPNANVARLVLPSGWTEPIYCYAYDSATETINNGGWPGKKMTKVEGTNNIYEYIVPNNIKAPRVIFYSSNTNRYPADEAPGLLFKEENVAYQLNGTSWEKISITVAPKPTQSPDTTISATPEPTKPEEVSATPEPTKPEEVSATPEPTNIEEVSVTPQPTKNEEASVTPNPTEPEEVSVTPKPTETEGANTTQKPTGTETASVTPSPTSSGETSVAPSPTGNVGVSVTPNPTGIGEESVTLEPTETVKASVTPKPTGAEGTNTTPKPTGIGGVSMAPKPSAAPTNKVKPTQIPKKGTKLTDKKTQAIYKVTKAGTKGGTVEYVKTTKTKATKITVPPTVKINGITYKVTSIANNAFSKNKQLKSVTIGKNVETIGSKAFYKCTALTKVTIPSKIKKIGKQAFYGCKKLKIINIKTKKLTSKNVGSKAFKGINSKATIKVPKSKITSYKKMLKAKGIGSKVKVKKQ